MREIRLILPLLFKAGFRKKQGEKGNPMLTNSILCAILLFYSISGGIAMIPAFVEFSENGMLAGFITIIFLVSALVTMLFSIAPMMSLLYFSKDGEFYLHLPVKASSVFMSKMIYLYVSQLYLNVATCAPLLVIVGISQNLTVAFYVLALLGVLLTPFLGLLLASVICVPLVAIASLFKNRGAVSSVALIVVYSLVIFGYMALVLSQNSISSAQIVTLLSPVIDGVSKYALPLYALANASVLANVTAVGTFGVEVAFLINIAISFIFFALVVFLAIVVGRAFYNKGVSALLEKRKSAQKGDNVLKKNRQFATLLGIESKTIMRNSSLAFNMVGSMISCPIIAIALSIGMHGEYLGYTAFGMAYAVIVGMGVSMNSCACMIFSKDGENFYALKYLPVDRKKVIGAKLVFCWLLSSAFIVVSVIVALIIMQQEWYQYFSLIPIPVLSLGITAMDMLWDLRRPNLSWQSISEVAKNSSKLLVPTFIGLGVMLVLLVGCTSFLVVFQELGYLFAYLFVLALGIIVSAIFLTALFKNGEKMIDRVE